MNYVLDGDGRTPRREPDVLAWARWMESHDRRVAVTLVGPADAPLHVSTVFLGIDHHFGLAPAAPVLFETMIFAPQGLAHEDYQERYATCDDAERGHVRAVAHAEGLVADQS